MNPLRHPGSPRLARALLVLLVAASTVAGARSSDRDHEVDIQARGLDGPISQEGDTIFTDVVITQGTLRIEAGRATVTREDGELTRVVLEGQPAALEQENDDGIMIRAKALHIDYDTRLETVMLTGSVQIDQGRDTFRGEQVSYDIRKSHIAGDGGQGGRIRLTIQPKPKPDREP